MVWRRVRNHHEINESAASVTRACIAPHVMEEEACIGQCTIGRTTMVHGYRDES
jgi:hypothetical protein